MEQTAQKNSTDAAKHLNDIKWILVCGFLVVLFFISTEPVVPSAAPTIQAICSNPDRLGTRNKLECMLYDITGRVLNPRVL
jgi:hypothetical protein